MIKEDRQSLEQFNEDYGRIIHGAFNWEARLRNACNGNESGQHTLRVIVRDGIVKDVVHTVEDHF